ncbi:hypothetical protein SAMN05216548_11762 [Faunimonas pinastri]|uniref:Uncharacterized protein n=1 Tax=Faunimonas pinastri TaxID=1855383 RepID=A0A1H9NVD3_9HYPH|nr:hypothetical protein [Faunimonas pinastri]SER39868.1 hypothetical protein SAMN05216548_11762 [Faunimonas pinastri]
MRKIIFASVAFGLLSAGIANAAGIPALQADTSGTRPAVAGEVSRGFLLFTDQNGQKRVVNQYAGQAETANSYGAPYFVHGQTETR